MAICITIVDDLDSQRVKRVNGKYIRDLGPSDKVLLCKSPFEDHLRLGIW